MANLPSPSFPVYDVPVQIVQGLLTQMSARVEDFTTLAENAVAQLGEFTGPEIGSPPSYTLGQVADPQFPTIKEPDPHILGTVDKLVIPDYQGIDASIAGLAQQLIADVGKVPVFAPDVGAIALPQAPGDPVIDALPAQPTINSVSIPAAPDINDPGVGDLIPFTIPDLPIITLPVFDATIPTFTDDAPSALTNWSEPVYQPLVRADVASAIQAMIRGDFAMPESVFTALVGASRDKEMMVTSRAVDQAKNEWASRGFDMPPGMVAEQINVARQEGALRENDRTRDIVQKRGDWANENLRTAVAQGISLEAQLIGYFNSFAQRTFDMAKFTVESQRLLFDSKVGLFRARNEQLNVLCTVFETKFKEALAPLEVVKVELQNQQLIGTINEQMLRAYQTRVQALGLLAQRFETLMNGAKVQSDIERNKVEIWKAQIDGFSAVLNAKKIPYEIYDTRVKAEGTKATILEAEARAFAATVEAFTAGENVKIAVLNGELRAIDSATQRFVANVNAQRDVIASEADAIRAEAAAYSADINRYGETLRFAGTKAQIKVQAQEANARNGIAFYDSKNREYDALSQRIIQIAGLQLEGIKAAGNITAQLAAGAMSAQHVQASVSGSGSASTSSGYSYSEVHSFDETQ